MGTPLQLSAPFLLELLRGQLGDIYPRYANLRRMGAMLRDASGIIVVTRHREVAQIIADPAFAFVGPQTFPAAGAEQRARLDASGFFDLLMFRSGGEHRETRRVLSELFSFNRIGRIRSAVEEMATGLARQLDGSLAFDFVPAVASTLPARMLVELIGLQAAEISTLVARSRAMTGLITAIPLAGDALSDNIRRSRPSAPGWICASPLRRAAATSIPSATSYGPCPRRRGNRSSPIFWCCS